jgi:hypothetical protein
MFVDPDDSFFDHMAPNGTICASAGVSATYIRGHVLAAFDENVSDGMPFLVFLLRRRHLRSLQKEIGSDAEGSTVLHMQ